jgi:hypothetical protein
MYNCRTRENTKLFEIKGKLEINSVKDGKLIYNDTEEINLDIQ